MIWMENTMLGVYGARPMVARVLVGAIAGLWSVAAMAAPAIMSPDPVYDFGEMDNSNKVERSFVVKNVGDEALVISDVKTTCGCTVAELEKNTLAPGEETTIAATFNLKGKQGVQSKKITVMSNDPETPNYILEIKGNSVATISLEPSLLNLGRIVDNDSHSQSVTVKSTKEGHTFKIERLVVPEDAQFSAEVEEVEPGKEYRITATTQPGLVAGMLNGRITVMTDDPSRKMMSISVYGHVIGALQIRPDVVTIRSNSDADAPRATQYLQVLPGRAKSFELLEVIAPIPNMKAELIMRKDNDYHIKLSDMPVDNSLKDKELIVTTNLPDRPEIRIPFRVLPSQEIQVGKTPSRVPTVQPSARPRAPQLPTGPSN